MSRLVDTTICPDCRGALDPSATCELCGLRLTGPLAGQLWTLMVAADGLVGQLRSLREPGTESVAPSPAQPLPACPSPNPRPTRAVKPRRLPAASVPVVLLSLGGLCLLVAAVVFVAVAWSLLGLTGRTLVLLGCTAAVAAVAVVLTRKGLRVASETFWMVVAGMLVVDLLGAQSAGLAGLDILTWRGTGALVGGALVTLGLSVGLWARRQPVTRSYGAESVAVLGAMTLAGTNAWFASNPAIGTSIAVPLFAAALVLLRRHVAVAAYGLGGVAAISWLVLLGIGGDRALENVTLGAWWSDVRGWPLVVAALLGAVVVLVPGVPARLRPVAAGLSLLPLLLLARAPQSFDTPTADRVVDSAVLAALSLLTAFAPLVWARGAAALTALMAVSLGLALVLAPWDVLLYLRVDGRADANLTMSAMTDNAASWAFLVIAIAVVAAAAALLRHASATAASTVRRVVMTVAPAVLALGALVLVLELQPQLWVGVLASALAAATAAVGAWSARDHGVAAWLGSAAAAYLTVVTLYAASASHLLVALVTTALLVGLAASGGLRDRAGSAVSAGVLLALAAMSGGWSMLAWGHVTAADLESRTLALAAYAGLVGVLAAPLTRRVAARVCVEGAAAALALLAVLSVSDERAVAMVLTVVGTGICLVAVTTRDRALLGWAGAFVLGMATLIRVVVEVRAPELYTLPAAALLVAVGAWRLRSRQGASSLTMLGSGLTLALTPSLLLALTDPVSLRGALIGLAGVVVLAVGVQQRLAAPFVLGAATTAVLALRHLEPLAEAVPRWVSLGGVGVLLLVVGVTWEARRRDLDQAQRYLTALR